MGYVNNIPAGINGRNYIPSFCERFLDEFLFPQIEKFALFIFLGVGIIELFFYKKNDQSTENQEKTSPKNKEKNNVQIEKTK